MDNVSTRVSRPGTATESGIVGAAIVPHAPQMLSLPKTEDHAQVVRVRAAMKEVGDRFRASGADLLIVISNDHGDDFALKSVPPFIVHCGNRAHGRDEHSGWWRLEGETGYALFEALQQEEFDPAFTLEAPLGTFFTIPFEFMGYKRDEAFLPLFVNSYVPPQPRPERCFAFGQALARAVKRIGRRAVVVASGGLSHYPGLARYADPGPDLATDREMFDRLSEGNLRFLLSYDSDALDQSGNVEARSLLILAGAIDNRRPDVAILEPNWHHTYAVVGWSGIEPAPAKSLYYGATPPHRVEVSRALHALRASSDAFALFQRDAAAFFAGFALNDEERQAIIDRNQAKLRDEFHVHPLLVFGALTRLGPAHN